MNLSKRNRAPITPQAWKHIDEEAKRVPQLNLPLRKPPARASDAVKHNIRSGLTERAIRPETRSLAAAKNQGSAGPSPRSAADEHMSSAIALQRSEERLRIIMEVTHDAVWEWDLITDTFERSASMRDLFGDTTVQCQPRRQWWDDHIHPDDRERVLSSIYALMQSGGCCWAAEYRLRRSDGSFATVCDRGEVIYDAGGAPVRMIGAMMDITAHKHAEEEIRGLRESLREETEVGEAVARADEELIEGLDRPALLDRVCQVATAVLRCDVSWIVLLNRERMHYAPVAAAGATPEQREEVCLLRFPADNTALLGTALGYNEVLQVTRSATDPVDPLALRYGSDVTLYVPLRRGQDLIGVLAAGRRSQAEPFAATDERIARRLSRLASLALEAAMLIETLAEATRLKADFVSTMSHELRTPMTVIMGYNDILRADVSGRLNDEQRTILLAMDHSAHKLLELINATLDLRRLEAGQVSRSIRKFDARQLLADVREDSRHLDCHGVRIAWKWSRNLARARTDAIKVKVILKNLLQNAVKFTKAGQVTVEAHTCRGGLDLSVTDTGTGIPEDARSFIFDPFRQVEAALTRHYAGVGLGLYVVRRLVDVLEGTITVESEVGRGSTFRVWFPNLPIRTRQPR